MQPYDIAMLAVLACATLFGLHKGLAWQVAALSSLAVSGWAAARFSDRLAPYIKQPAPLDRFIAMLVIYLLTSLAIWLALAAVSRAIERVRLKTFDRQLGALVGVANGLLLCLAITFFTVTLSDRGRESVHASLSGIYLARLIELADVFIPKNVHAQVDPYLREFEQQLQPAARRLLPRGR
jgi:membrane protein required for colicin V production